MRYLILLIPAFLFCATPSFLGGERLKGREFKSSFRFDVADFNGDGKKDVVVLGYGKDRGWIHYNIGTLERPAFGFADRLNINLSETEPVYLGGAQSIQAVDFDKDGDSDLLLQRDDRNMSALRPILVTNTGTPQRHFLFRGHAVSGNPWTGNPYFVRSTCAADWDGDGLMDFILYSDRNDSNACWFDNTKSNDSLAVLDSSSHHEFRTAPGHLVKPDRVQVADWNSDGLPDLLGSGPGCGNRLRVWLGTEVLDSVAPYFEVPNVHSGTRAVVTDFNSDGKKDAVVMDTACFLRIYWNQGTDAAPAFPVEPETLYASDFSHVDDRATPFFIDWNRDGRRDLILGGANDAHCGSSLPLLRLYLNESRTPDETPCFGLGQNIRYRTPTSSFYVPVVDGDTKWGGLSCPAIADFNHDGFMDIFVAIAMIGNTAMRYLIYAPGDSATEQSVVFGEPVNAGFASTGRLEFLHIANADYNADGLPDLLTSSADSVPLRAYVNSGTADSFHFSDSSFVALAPRDSVGLYQGLDMGDLSGDGRPDLVVGVYGKLRYFENAGLGGAPLFSAYSYLAHKDSAVPVTIGPLVDSCWVTRRISQGASVALTDLDNDNDSDLVCGYRTLCDGPSLLAGCELWLFRNAEKTASVVAGPAAAPARVPRLTVSPNPFKACVRISLANGLRSGAVLRVFDLRGGLVADLSASLRSGEAAWNAKGMPSGVYVAAFENKGVSARQKIILMR